MVPGSFYLALSLGVTFSETRQGGSQHTVNILIYLILYFIILEVQVIEVRCLVGIYCVQELSIY